MPARSGAGLLNSDMSIQHRHYCPFRPLPIRYFHLKRAHEIASFRDLRHKPLYEKTGAAGQGSCHFRSMHDGAQEAFKRRTCSTFPISCIRKMLTCAIRCGNKAMKFIILPMRELSTMAEPARKIRPIKHFKHQNHENGKLYVFKKVARQTICRSLQNKFCRCIMYTAFCSLLAQLPFFPF